LNTTPTGASILSFALTPVATADRGRSLAVGDINGDGKPDLVVPNARISSTLVSVLLNTTPTGASTPSFEAPQIFGTGNYAGSVGLGDFNGDGKPDLAIANSIGGFGRVSVLLNMTTPGASTASFAAQQDFATTRNYPSSLVVADLNGDGQPDLAVTNHDSTMSIFLNATAPGAIVPTFSDPQIFAVGPYPYSLAVADLNGDGRPDLALGYYNTHHVSVLLNKTAPGATTVSIADPQTFSSGGVNSSPFSLAVGDFNGDGNPDLAVANCCGPSGSVSVLLNTRVPITIAPSFAAQQTFIAGTGARSVAVGDFNGDGKLDLAVANIGSNDVSVLLNTTAPGDSTPSFAGQVSFFSGNEPFSVAVGDFNGDGRLDLVVANFASQTVSVFLNTTAPGASTPTFAPRQTFSTGRGPVSVAAGDLNGDGRSDLVVANSSDVFTVSALLNTTPPGAAICSFAAQQRFDFNLSSPSSVAVGDFNGDGKPDLAITDSGTPTKVSVVLNTTVPGASACTFAPARSFPAADLLGNAATSVVVGDFNGDGKPDLAVASWAISGNGAGTVSVLLNTTSAGASTPSFAPQQSFSAGTQAFSIATGDFDGDGKPDLAVANAYLGMQGAVSVLLNTTALGASAPSFAAQQTFGAGPGATSVAVGDFNGDGRPDFVVANDGAHEDANTVSALLNTMVPVSLNGSPATGTIQDNDAPASITIAAGNNQSAVVNTAFATNLAVDVRNAAGNLVQGVTVTFTAPASGPSGTFGASRSITVVTNASGQATAPTFTANALDGSYTVTVQAGGGTDPAVNLSLTNVPAVGVTHFMVVAPSSSTAGSAFDVTVSALDSSNHVVTNYAGTIHFTSSDGSRVLPSDYTFLTGDRGVHTFMSAVILRTAGSQTVSVNDTVNAFLTGNGPVLVDPASADHLAFSQQPTNTVASATISPAVTVRILDAFNNLLIGDSTDQVALVIGTNPGGGTLSGTTRQTASGGIATFDDLAINKPGSGYTLVASSTGLTGATSSDFDITPRPTHLAFAVLPSDTVAGMMIAPAVTVQVEDSSNDVVIGDNTDQVTIAIGRNPGGGTLTGTLTVTVHNGVATYNDMSINKSGTDYTLTATSGALTGDTSAEFNITPAAADHLFLLQQPTDTVAGEAIAPAIEVEVLDRFGNLTSSTANVSVAIGTNPGEGTLSGTTTQAASGGIAAFGDLSIDKTGIVYTLAATSSGLTGITSDGFDITPAAADHLFFLQQPSDAVPGQTIAPAVEVEILDRFGNLTPSTANVSMAIGTNPAGGTLSGTMTESATGGVATFADLSIDKTGTGYTLVANSSALTGATSNSFNILLNHPPVLDPISDMGLSLNRSLTFTAHATDPDSPPETLTFSLDPGAPGSAHIDPVIGVFSVSNLKMGAYTITVRVTDNGNPPLSATQTFHVFVAPQVKGITLNGGSIKNPTVVTFLTVTFNTRVNIDPGAFELTRLGSGGGPVGVTVASVSVINGKTVVTLQFSGSFVLPGGVLASGQYSFTTHGGLIHDAVTGLALDGDNGGLPGGDNLFSFMVP
jgi:hypothetical protein